MMLWRDRAESNRVIIPFGPLKPLPCLALPCRARPRRARPCLVPRSARCSNPSAFLSPHTALALPCLALPRRARPSHATHYREPAVSPGIEPGLPETPYCPCLALPCLAWPCLALPRRAVPGRNPTPPEACAWLPQRCKVRATQRQEQALPRSCSHTHGRQAHQASAKRSPSFFRALSDRQCRSFAWP